MSRLLAPISRFRMPWLAVWLAALGTALTGFGLAGTEGVGIEQVCPRVTQPAAAGSVTFEFGPDSLSTTGTIWSQGRARV